MCVLDGLGYGRDHLPPLVDYLKEECGSNVQRKLVITRDDFTGSSIVDPSGVYRSPASVSSNDSSLSDEDDSSLSVSSDGARFAQGSSASNLDCNRPTLKHRVGSGQDSSLNRVTQHNFAGSDKSLPETEDETHVRMEGISQSKTKYEASTKTGNDPYINTNNGPCFTTDDGPPFKTEDDDYQSSSTINSSRSVSPDKEWYAQTSSVSSFDSDTVPYTVPLEQRQNPRRTSASTNATPPFKRADENHQTFVEGLLVVTASFVEAIWPSSRETPRSSTDFNGAGVLPLRTFIQETCRRSRTSYSTLQIALYYLVLLKGVLQGLDCAREQPRDSDIADAVPRDPRILWGQPTGPSGCRVMQCGRRMFMSALMLAAKYLQDRNFSVKAWAKISGLSCQEINKNEKAYLQSIEYRLHLKKEHFENWSRIVFELCDSEKKKRPLDYSKIIRRLNPEIIHDFDNTNHFLKEVGEGKYLAFSSNSVCPPPGWRRPFHEYSYGSLPSTRTPSLRRSWLESQTRGSTNPQELPATVHNCPPPLHGSTSLSTNFRTRTISPPWSSSAQSTNSSSSSPESSTESIFSSDCVEFASRSRSSSISSASSFGALGAMQGFRYDAKSMPYPSPLGQSSVTAAAPFGPWDAQSVGRVQLIDQSGRLNQAPERPQTEVACAKRKASSAPMSSENAAATLVLLSKDRGQHAVVSAVEDKMLAGKKAQKKRGPTKGLKAGHTSEAVKARRHRDRETSRMIKSGHGLPSVLPDDIQPYTNFCSEPVHTWCSDEEEECALEEKEVQACHKKWAESRKPVLVAHNPNKRYAAAEVAAAILRPEAMRTKARAK